ncbi:MAG TPA: hypothetical protein VMC02_04700 [Steroidobacteraceae bacterium]|nr:hypothetical protein [Steroidobacteraceae bacterium]
MTRSLRHDRLMRVSHSHVAATARDDGHEQQQLVQRLMQEPCTYTQWENRHSQLMQQVCRPRRLRAQIVCMRALTLSLIHRRAVFEYLRDGRITGEKRHRYIALFYGARDYANAPILEHARYTRSWVSASCSRFIGAQLLHDPAFEAPMAEYEQKFAQYFRLYCELQLATPQDAGAACGTALLPMLKESAREARERLIRLN